MSASSGLAERFLASAEQDAVVALDGRRLTYRDLHARAGTLARWCAASGARPGDRIAVELANGPDLLTWYFACYFGGFVMVPVNPELSAEEIGRAHV